MRITIVIALIMLSAFKGYGQVTMSTSGNWSDPTVWTAGTVPTGTSGTTAAPVSVGLPATIDQNIDITSGVYYFGYTGTSGSGTNATDQPGGTAYNLSVSNAVFSATQSIIDIRSGTTTFEGTGYFNNSTLIIRAGATLILGPTYADKKVVINVLGTLIINGDFGAENNNNGSSFTVGTGGIVIVNGNFTAPVGSVAISGGGDLFTTGTIDTNGNSSIFGSTQNCTVGPCSGRNLCTYSNTISANQEVCSGVTPAPLTATVTTTPVTVQWQMASTLDGFAAYSPTGTFGADPCGSCNITGANSSTGYSPPAVTTASVTTRYYRLYIDDGSCVSYSYPIQITTLGNGGWISNTNTSDATRDNWNVASNWCGTTGVPISTTAVNIYSLPPSSGRLMPIIKSADANAASVTIGSGATSSGVTNASLTLNAGYTLNIHGVTSSSSTTAFTFSNNGTFTSSSTGTVAFVGTSSSITSSQTIGGSSFNTFGNLTFNSTGTPTNAPNYTLKNNNIVVQGTLSLLKGKLNLNGFTIQLGTSPTVANKGTLSYTSGWMYGGNFQRYFDTSSTIVVGTVAGLFPMGIITDYRPFSVGYSPALSTGGWIKLAHTGTQYTFLDPADFFDNPPTNTVSVKRTTVSYWASTKNGIDATGSPFTIEAGGTSFSDPATLSDFRLTLATSVVGSNGTTSGSSTDPRIQRTGLTATNLANTFYVGTINEATTPLPISLLNFSAVRSKHGVDLLWKTLSEENVDFFEVERSINARDFISIGKVIGNGTSKEIHEYRLFDEKVLLGKNYYRLKSVDFDGYTEYFNVVMVDFDGSKNFSVSPNPSEGVNFTAETNFTPESRAFVVIYTTLGAEIGRYEVSGSKSLLSMPVKLESGVYYAKYISSDFTATNRILVK